MESKQISEDQKKHMEQLNQLKLLLYPESLEQYSKVTSILSDDFSFKIENLLNLKEVQKFVKEEPQLISLLKEIASEKNSFLVLDEGKKEGTITISERFMKYNFVNFPFNYNEKKVIEILKLKEGDYTRIYKQSLFWIVISENVEFIETFEKFIKDIKIEDSPLKCNITSGMMLKNVISKNIMNYTLKEVNDLNILGKRKESDASYHSKDKGEEMSWRKKSDDSDLAVGPEKYDKKGRYKGGNKKKRQRFKSDPMDWNQGRRNLMEPQGNQGRRKNKYDSAFGTLNENLAAIDTTSVKYPLTIKFKYSNREIVDFYNKIKNLIPYEKSIFKCEIEDIISKENKAIIVAEKDNLHAEIPKNNPLLSFKSNK